MADNPYESPEHSGSEGPLDVESPNLDDVETSRVRAVLFVLLLVGGLVVTAVVLLG